MTVPLVVLAALTVIAGWAVGVPSSHGTRFDRFMGPVFGVHGEESSGLVTYMLVVLSSLIAVGGIALAWARYVSTPVRPEVIGRPGTPLHAFLLNAWYVDALYDRAIVRPLAQLSTVCARIVDAGVIDGAVNLSGRLVIAWAAGIRRLQSGYVVNYALTMLAGAVVLVGYLLTR
jgi:NADH-quinone oxidoreductase subunit L